MTDDLRAKGTVTVECGSCHWHFWVDYPKLPDGPFECVSCFCERTGQQVILKADA